MQVCPNRFADITAKMPTHEKVETIVFSFLRNGCRSGNLGTLEPTPADGYLVTVDGLTFTIGTCRLGWSVRHGDYTGVDSMLIDAARLALHP